MRGPILWMFFLFAAGNSHGIDFSKAPATTEWKAFQGLSPELRDQNVQLGSWPSWNWRWKMGWVSSCSRRFTKTCLKVFRLASLDKAALVRAALARSLGARFSPEAHPWARELIVSMVQTSFKAAKFQPIFYRDALWTLNKWGDPQSLATGKKLAMSNASTRNYWNKITSL